MVCFKRATCGPLKVHQATANSMAINKLTDRAIRNAKPGPAEYELTDGGGLALRVKVDGAKIWAVRYVSPTTGTRRREYLGSYPEISLQDARQALAERRALLAKRVDPGRAGAVLGPKGHGGPPMTAADLFTVWWNDYVQSNRSSEDDRQAIQSRFGNYCAPMIGDIRLTDIRRGHIMMVLDGVRATGAMRTTNVVLGELRQMFRYAAAREWLQGDPTAAISRKDAGGTDNEGERILSDVEIVQLRDILAKPPESKSQYYTARRRVLPIRTELAVWWTLATLGRAVEIASMQVALVNKEARTWAIPSDVSKNTDAHVVHLSDFALVVWDRLLPLAGDRYVFVGRKDGMHVSEKEVTRRLTDRQTKDVPLKGRKNSAVLDLPGGRWTQHDLRRTGSTIMGECGISPEVIDRCLNHREAKRVTRTYQRQKMLPQRVEAFNTLGEHLAKLLGDPRDWLPPAA